jgi:hypothetical protein
MNVAALSEPDWQRLVRRLPIELEASARAHGALVRRRGLTDAATLLRLALVYGATPFSLRSTVAWAEMTGVASISDVALLYRLQAAEGWLKWLFEKYLSLELKALTSCPMPVFWQGYRLRVVDGTVLKRTPEAGVESRSVRRGWRLHTAMDLATGRLDEVEIARFEEGERLDRFKVRKNEIMVGDRGFAGVRGLQAVSAQGGDFIVRRGIGNRKLMASDGSRLDEAAILALAQKGQPVDMPVIMPPARNDSDNRYIPAERYKALPPLACRLIILPLSPQAAHKARQRTAHIIAHKRQKPRPERLPASGFVYLLTSLPQSAFDAASIGQLYRLRWQIETAFKRLKSLIHFDQFQAVDERLVKSVLYAKLILALMSQNLVGQILALSPSEPYRTAPNQCA